MIGALGAIFTVLLALFAVTRTHRLPWLLSAAMPFSSTAAYVIAGQSIVMYHVVAAVLVAVAVKATSFRGVLGADFSARPGLRMLIYFGVWSTAVTVVAPIIFAGTRVLNPRDGIDAGVQDPASLAPQISNLAQIGYLTIGIATVAAIGSMRSVSPHLPAAGFVAGTVLSSVKGLLPVGLQQTLFDNSANVIYTAGAFNGIERMRGVFSEPSALGAFSVGAMVFFALSASNSRGHGRRLCIAMAAWALLNAVLSFSGGAVISGLAILAVLAARAAVRYLIGRSAVSATALVAALLLVPTTIVCGPPIYGFISLVVDDKTDSTSYVNRSAADAFSVDLSWHTAGIGVGVGSNRPSSFFAMLLSNIGVLGLILFTVAGVVIVLGAMRAGRQWQPAAWALVAVLVGKVVAGPDLSEPVMWFLLSLCAHAAWHGRPDLRRSASSPPAGRLLHAAS